MNSTQIGRADIDQLQKNAHEEGDLLVWTVYDHPKDFPDTYIVRPHSSSRAKPLAVHFSHPDLELIRYILERAGLICMQRSEADDPTIVETWI